MPTVSSPSPNYYGGDRLKAMPLGTSVTCGRMRNRQGGVEPPAGASRHLGCATSTPRPPWSTSRRTDKTIPALIQATKHGLPLRAQPQHGRAGLSDRGAALSRFRLFRAKVVGQDPALCAAAANDRHRRTWPPVSSSSPISSASANAAAGSARIRDEGPLHRPPILTGSISLARDSRRRGMGRRRAGSHHQQTYVVNSNVVRADLSPWCRAPMPTRSMAQWRLRTPDGYAAQQGSALRLQAGELPQSCGACPAGRRLMATCPAMT